MSDAIDPEVRLKRARWRAEHRGTKEADMLVGGFAQANLTAMNPDELRWFEALMDEQDVDIMAWAFGTAEPPAHYAGEMMERLRRLDYLKLPGR